MSDALIDARTHGLHYVTDQERGLTRARKGEGFTYSDAQNRTIRDAATLDRIAKLVIPPAWTEVWICPDPRGHLQASGRDAKGRKQHRYHEKFRAARDEAKFGHMVEFAVALPKLRAAIEKDSRRPGLPREKVLATIVRLLDRSLIRVGNEEYAEQNKSYGLTTLRGKHVAVAGDSVKFVFKGKSGKDWRVELKDRRVAKAIKAIQDLPGQRLFQYLDEDGGVQHVTSTDVNDYLRETSGREISAKDFRTWAGTVLAASELIARGAAESETASKRAIREAIVTVAARLGNTPTICRKCYVHPSVVAQYAGGALAEALDLKGRRARKGLSKDETMVLAFLKREAAPKRRTATLRKNGNKRAPQHVAAASRMQGAPA